MNNKRRLANVFVGSWSAANWSLVALVLGQGSWALALLVALALGRGDWKLARTTGTGSRDQAWRSSGYSEQPPPTAIFPRVVLVMIAIPIATMLTLAWPDMILILLLRTMLMRSMTTVMIMMPL